MAGRVNLEEQHGSGSEGSSKRCMHSRYRKLIQVYFSSDPQSIFSIYLCRTTTYTCSVWQRSLLFRATLLCNRKDLSKLVSQVVLGCDQVAQFCSVSTCIYLFILTVACWDFCVPPSMLRHSCRANCAGAEFVCVFLVVFFSFSLYLGLHWNFFIMQLL